MITADELLTGLELHELAAGHSRATVRVRLGVARRVLALGCPPTVEAVEQLLADAAAPATRAAYRQHVRALARFAGWHELAEQLPRVRVPRRLPRPVPEPVLERALMVAEPRVRRGLLLGAYAGCRVAEAAAVAGEHVTAGGLLIRGKGGHERLVPLHPLLAVELAGLTGWAFPSSHGGHLTADYLGHLVAEQLGEPWTFHTLRHRFATRLYGATGDLRVTQELLGHASPETTARYVAVTPGRLSEAVALV